MDDSQPKDPRPDPNGPQEQPNAEQPTAPPQPLSRMQIPENPKADPRHVDNVIAEIKKQYPSLTDKEIDELMM
jgi:hypothetical protein